MREMLFEVAPLVLPVSGFLLGVALVTLVAAICAQDGSVRKFLLGTSLVFVVALFVFGCFGLVVAMATVKEALVAGGS
ncbi:MAG: hypothetical protein AAB561_01365 [Patescibacteria group bacterium]